MTNDRYVTIREAAELLRVEPRTVRNWIRRGALPACRTPGRRGRLRIHAADLQLVLAPARGPEESR